MLGLFLGTFTADDKSFRHNRDNFPQQIQIQVSQKPKTLSRNSIVYLKYTSTFEYFQVKDESRRLSISKIFDSERGGYLNV